MWQMRPILFLAQTLQSQLQTVAIFRYLELQVTICHLRYTIYDARTINDLRARLALSGSTCPSSALGQADDHPSRACGSLAFLRFQGSDWPISTYPEIRHEADGDATAKPKPRLMLIVPSLDSINRPARQQIVLFLNYFRYLAAVALHIIAQHDRKTA